MQQCIGQACKKASAVWACFSRQALCCGGDGLAFAVAGLTKVTSGVRRINNADNSGFCWGPAQ